MPSPTAANRVARRVSIALIAATCAAAGPTANAQAPQRLVKMEYEATLTELEDPLHIFPEVRIGDSVRGTITYDHLNAFFFFLDHPAWLNVATMVVENPRGGPETQFPPDPAGDFNIGSVLNDWEGEEFDLADGVVFSRSVLAPEGFLGVSPAITVSFLASAAKFEDLEFTLPSEIVLEEWPIAAVSFFDLADGDPSGTALVAEIHTLRSVLLGPGDFDADGAVDAHDLALWQEEFGVSLDGDPFHPLPYADADLDGDADGNDFLTWQQNLGLVALTGGAAVFVPEPAGSLLVVASLAAAPFVRRRDSL